MTLCVCGKPAETFGGMCDRCASLQMLGLTKHASPEEIENAYLTLVKVWHPDRFPADPKLRQEAEDRLKEINAAHDFLASDSPQPELQRPPEAQQESSSVPKRAQHSRPFLADPEAEESEEVKRILRRQQKSPVPRVMLRVGFLIGGVALAALVWMTADAILSSNPNTQRSWEEMKAEVGRELHASQTRLAPGADASSSTPAETPPATPASAAPAAPAPAPPESKQHAHPARIAAPLNGARPYVTSGLSPMEVLSALGKPTSSTGEKMLYGASEIDFKNGQVTGWKIDPNSAPIRVKLWPDSPLAPGMTTFGAGSSKSDVIALQGTPTLFSDNEFGYGNSLVFFKNNRVVSWKEDPSSVRLRVAH